MEKMKALEQIVADAKVKADKIIGQSKSVRDAFAAGRPNSSEESTIEGTLEALQIILRSLPDERGG